MSSLITSSLVVTGTKPKVYLLAGQPTVYTLTPTLSRPVITMISGAELPFWDAAALEDAGAYMIVCEEHGSPTSVYVGEAGSLELRFDGHTRLQTNDGSVFVIAITAQDDDLTKHDVRTLERLIYRALAHEPNIELDNLLEPSHAPVDQERFEQLCALTADVLTRIGQAGLLPLEGSWREGLTGSSLCAELLVEPPLEELIGAQRMRIQGRGYKAEALFLVDGRCLLKAGGHIRSFTARKIPTRAAIHRQEALYAGLLVEQDGALVVTRDLLFPNPTRLARFVTGSTCGKWKVASPAKVGPRSASAAWLTLWREAAPGACTKEDAKSIRKVLERTGLLGEPDWTRAVQGDLTAAVRAALRVTNRLKVNSAATGALDLVMSALMACAIDGTRSAADVFEILLFRLQAKGLNIGAGS